jgi:hypothetical protein
MENNLHILVEKIKKLEKFGNSKAGRDIFLQDPQEQSLFC